MIYALQRIQNEMRDRLQRYGIEINPEANTILYRDTAYRFANYTPTTKLKQRIRICIRDAKQRQAADRAKKQINLFGE